MAPARFAFALCAIAAVTVAGCSAYPGNLAAGQTCVRSAQCAPGLVCSAGMCTNDLSMFGMGRVPNLDGGPDTGPPVDAGDDADLDAFMDDTGIAPVDAFVPPVDTGLPPVDAFVPPVDAFVPPVDAFVPPVDAFVPPVDAFAGVDADVDAGP